jgi:hypothetical protein
LLIAPAPQWLVLGLGPLLRACLAKVKVGMILCACVPEKDVKHQSFGRSTYCSDGWRGNYEPCQTHSEEPGGLCSGGIRKLSGVLS